MSIPLEMELEPGFDENLVYHDLYDVEVFATDDVIAYSISFYDENIDMEKFVEAEKWNMSDPDRPKTFGDIDECIENSIEVFESYYDFGDTENDDDEDKSSTEPK